ncbi:hypothetical protein Cni_G17073 [Canna indica]|uniref:DUF4283 domain-containing protein n=1 Tax=Canna indica TaxID=4628 RepID=A0AAQ3KGA6_9LILI|nr:hypothetical protein Cni_G17073 [Canna indica]
MPSSDANKHIAILNVEMPQASINQSNSLPSEKFKYVDSSRLFVSVSNPLFDSCPSGLNDVLFVENKEVEDDRVNSGYTEKKIKKKLPVSWADLFRAANVSDNLPKKNEVVDRIRNIQESSMNELTIEDELINSARKKWSLSLYGKFYGKSPTLGLVQFMMPKIWKTKSELRIVDLDAGFFCFRFSNSENYEMDLSGGSWFMRGQALLLKPWKPNFQPLLERIDTIPIWVQFPGLPVEYLQENILRKLVESVGQFIKIDEVTMRRQRAKYARVCVLWDLTRTVPNGIWVKSS